MTKAKPKSKSRKPTKPPKSKKRPTKRKPETQALHSLPLSHPLIIAVLAFVVALGGSYAGYEVSKSSSKYGINFSSRPHLVQNVLDGDTFIIDDGIKVRMLGVNAPELGSCYGQEAKQQLSKLILGKEVFLDRDLIAKDKHNRLLRYVFLFPDSPEADGTLVNKSLAAKGYATVDYTRDNKRYYLVLENAENQAVKKGLGMWGKCDYAPDTAAGQKAAESPSDSCQVKGNISERYERLYLYPGCPNYKVTKIDYRKGEKWFCSEQEAIKAGWHINPSCNNLKQKK